MDNKEMFTIILKEIRESHAETSSRLDNLDVRMDSLEREVKSTKQLVQNFKWDIDLISDKQAKSELVSIGLKKG